MSAVVVQSGGATHPDTRMIPSIVELRSAHLWPVLSVWGKEVVSK